jgi:hypothetical protein
MSVLRRKIEDALKDIARMREANYTTPAPPAPTSLDKPIIIDDD